MAAISSDIEVEVQPSPRNTRVNEIVAIALMALGLLLFLCLFSYNPSDLSWNAAGESGSHNWIGAVGAKRCSRWPTCGHFLTPASTPVA